MGYFYFPLRKDRLAAPLATLEVLISDPPNPDHRYQWGAGPCEPATEANVLEKGSVWFNRLSKQDGDVAFFYCCGHGASHLSYPTLFLEDLNKEGRNPWSHIALQRLAHTLGKNRRLSAAFLFSDACGEYIPAFDLAQAQECRFYEVADSWITTRNHVSLLCAAPEAQVAYEGADAPSSSRKFGRFTQVCLKGLDGASARLSRSGWGVLPRDLGRDMTNLRNIFFSHWGDKEPFNPFEAIAQMEERPILYPKNIQLPVVVMTAPAERMPDYRLVISDRKDPQPPWLRSRDAGSAMAWATTVPPGRDALYAIAVKGSESHPRVFVPTGPLFFHDVEVP